MKNYGYCGVYLPVSSKICGRSGVTISRGMNLVRLIGALVCVAAFLLFSGCTVSDPVAYMDDKYGSSDEVELNAANAVNMSGVLQTKDGCYIIAGGKGRKYEIRWYPGGGSSYEVLYSSVNTLRCLAKLGDRIFFVNGDGIDAHLVSVSESGQDMKTELEKYNVQSVFVYGSRMYYVCNGYGSSGSAALVGVMEASGSGGQVLKVLESSDIKRVLEYKGRVYILYSSSSDYKGHVMVMNTGDADSAHQVSLVGGANEDIYSIVPLGGRVYFSNVSGGSEYGIRTMYSMAPDCSDISEVASVAGSYMVGYGDHIFYVSVKTDGNENSYELHSIRNDGTNDAFICDRPMIDIGIVYGRLYYNDPENSEYCRMMTDGGSVEII